MQRKETEDEAILAIIKPVFEKHKSRYGYRRVQSEAKSELKGVNHRYLDVNIRMPKKLNFFEKLIFNLKKLVK
mgnify:CR=1 FL=1